ncbi:hypothetical protein [Azohydromonas caseinilytica]|uniref:Uncharacterized protein n=1 Tax=Azohydromonas caseinilytica TaxID=2728836 RepID=A0A848FIM6_9BURK|nr:hypothetical protein [Azohydromonas caseinilytica]NML19006.1 hypothetical protein [Azohydromonas caseinilytica]
MGTSISPGEQGRQPLADAGLGPEAPMTVDVDGRTAAPVPPQAEPAHDEPVLGVTLDLFGDGELAGPLPGPARDRSRSRSRRNASAAHHPPAAPDQPVASPFKAPAYEAAAPVVPRWPAAPEEDSAGLRAETLRRAVEQALLTLPSEQLQTVVGQVAGTIVRSAEFQLALRAQLYTLVAPAITQALREALSLQEIRQSLRETCLPGAAALPGALGREPSSPAMLLPQAAAPASAMPEALEPRGNAVLLIGYEPAIARSYKTALAEAGYEAFIAEIGPNDQSLPVEAWQCAIACLPDDAVEHVESVVSRHPFHQVLHLSVTARRLVEAVELALPLPQDQS